MKLLFPAIFGVLTIPRLHGAPGTAIQHSDSPPIKNVIMAAMEKPVESKKPVEKQPKSPAAGRSLTGTFKAIEEGDYLHWLMTDNKGKEISFFILTPDASIEAVLKDPKKWIGKSCTITWKTSMEAIPEAGGKMKVNQILHVEWAK